MQGVHLHPVVHGPGLQRFQFKIEINGVLDIGGYGAIWHSVYFEGAKVGRREKAKGSMKPAPMKYIGHHTIASIQRVLFIMAGLSVIAWTDRIAEVSRYIQLQHLQ
jgi:hypothetical protein